MPQYGKSKSRWLMFSFLSCIVSVRSHELKFQSSQKNNTFVCYFFVLMFLFVQSKGPKFAELCRAVAMQVAASPTVDFVRTEDINADVREAERKAEMMSEDLEGKPDDIKAKMVRVCRKRVLIDCVHCTCLQNCDNMEQFVVSS